MDLPNSFSGLSIEPSSTSPRQQQQPSENLDRSAPKQLEEIDKAADEMVDPNAPPIEEIYRAFQFAKTADDLLDAFLLMVSLNVAIALDVDGDDPEKILSFGTRALSAVDVYEKPTIHVAIALDLVASATYRLSRFDESLACLDRAVNIVGMLMEEGASIDIVRSFSHKLHRELAKVYMSMGKRDDAFDNLRKCLEILEMNLEEPNEDVGEANFDLAVAYVQVLNYHEALPFCLKALEIHVNLLGHDSIVVMRDRRLLTHIHRELHEYEKALEENRQLQKVLTNLGLSSELLHSEIDAADLNIWLGKYDEALVILRRALQKTDKESEARAQVLVSMANALYKQEKFVDAKRCLETASGILDDEKIEKTQGVSEVYGKMGMLYETMKEFQLAISLYKRMLAIIEEHPGHKSEAAMSRARIGRTLLRSGAVEEAISYLESAAKQMFDSIGPDHIGLANVYKYLGAACLLTRQSEVATQLFAAVKAITGKNSSSIEACQKSHATMESCNNALEKQQRVIASLKRKGQRAQDELREANRHLEQITKRARVAADVFQHHVMELVLN